MTRATDIATVMRVLADPTRRAVFEQIAAAGELTVGVLTERNDVSQPAISQHVRALKAAGDLIRHSLLKVSRVRLGGLSFEGLKMGAWRDLAKSEINDLRHRAGLA